MPKLYSAVHFSKDGCMRGFASGFTKSKMKNILFEETMEGKLSIIVEGNNLSKLPSKYLDDHYFKTSKNTEDLKDIMNILKGGI